MNRVDRTLLALALLAFVLLGCGGAWASNDHQATENRSAVHVESSAAPAVVVTGTMIGPSMKLAVISLMSPEGTAGEQVLASEGEVVGAYRVVSIDADRVVFEREGHRFAIRVGAERRDALGPPPPTAAYVRTRSAPIRVVAPPPNIDEVRQHARTFVDLLKANPEFQKRLHESWQRVRERGTR
jgi:type II secretory pathway component PulC